MRRTQRGLALLLALCLLLLSACGERRREAEENVIDDKYRNWYEVFVYSYYDSDGDRIGDLAGLVEKLDYIASLGMNGIWLMPIMPSPSYHKYDVTDYYDIDPQYGTLEDFSALLEKAHSLGIDVIIDLVVNHTSSEHPWFLSAKADANSEYREYYNWSDEPRDGYAKAGGSYYECRFVNTMPDLNLDNPEVRAEIERILRFWLEDVGVDGFRLDAVTSYYTGERERNIDFLSWLGETARAISPDCYIVGEAWTDLYEIADYCAADIDSFFLFPVAQSGGYIEEILGPDVKEPGRSYANVTALLEQRLPEDTIPAPLPRQPRHAPRRERARPRHGKAEDGRRAAGHDARRDLRLLRRRDRHDRLQDRPRQAARHALDHALGDDALPARHHRGELPPALRDGAARGPGFAAQLLRRGDAAAKREPRDRPRHERDTRHRRGRRLRDKAQLEWRELRPRY